MNIHLFHGFNVRDGGSGSIDKFAPFFTLSGASIVQHDYGWVGPLRLRRRNDKAIARSEAAILPGDTLIAHSNGCLIAWRLVQAGVPVSAVICIQPALRRDTLWREDVSVLCLYNPDDWIVSLGRMWGRFASVANPFRNRHGWGAAGRYGFTAGQPNVENWNTKQPPTPATGHSGIFQTNPVLHWGPKLSVWALTLEKTA